MTTHSSTPIARVRDVADLLGVIPHLLGFHPAESLVVMVMVDSQVQVTARVDLVDLEPAGHLELLIDRLSLRWPRATFWLVGYSAAERYAWRLLNRAARHVGDAMAGDPLCVSGGHYRVGDAYGPRFRHDPASSQSAATATVHGLQARPSREVLRRSVQVDPRMSAEAETAWVAALDRLVRFDAHELPGEMVRALARHLGSPFGVPRAESAWLAALANVPEARDRALVAITRDDAEAHADLWSRVVRDCPYGTQQQALALLGMAAWVSGNGALQSVCLEELEQQGATLPLQSLLEGLNEAIVPPSYWDELRGSLVRAMSPLPEPVAPPATYSSSAGRPSTHPKAPPVALQMGADQIAGQVSQTHGESPDDEVA